MGRSERLFHQQHLTSALDGASELALVASGKPSVFAGQDAALIGYIAPEEVHVLGFKIGNVHVHFWLGPGSATCGSGGLFFARGHVT